MNQLLGLAITGFSVLGTAIFSGLRLKPYIDAGATRTPLSLFFYPAVIAVAITIPIVFILRKLQGTKDIEIGPVTFPDRMSFIVFGCWIYMAVAVSFFPPELPEPPPPFYMTDPHPAPLPGTDISVF